MGEHAQSEHFGRVSSLNRVSFGLASVTCNDGEVESRDGKDGTTILSVGVEAGLRRLCNRRHGEEDGGRKQGLVSCTNKHKRRDFAVRIQTRTQRPSSYGALVTLSNRLSERVVILGKTLSPAFTSALTTLGRC